MAAYEAAIAAGADGIEADVHLTRDGHLVMLHDELVDRTTDGHGPVAEMTMAEVAILDAGGWFGLAFRGLRVPTMEQLLDLARGSGTVLCLEAKGADHGRTQEVAVAISDRLAERGEIDTHVVASFDHDALAAAAARHPGLQLAPDRLPERGPLADEDLIEQARRVSAPIIQVHHAELTAVTVAALHDAGIAIWAWPTTNVEAIEAAHSLGVDGLMGDDAPALVRASRPTSHPRSGSNTPGPRR
jgi:glycerophosphoryl diester phosphodiesterase